MQRHEIQFLGLSLLTMYWSLAVSSVFGETPKSIATLVQGHCTSCHSGDSAAGGLNFDDLKGIDSASTDAATISRKEIRQWVQIFDRVASGEMPPKGEPRPEKALIESFLNDLTKILTPADFETRPALVRRLNRVEYENTICDLFATRVSVKDNLPEDPMVQGFDTVGEGLAISAEQIETYLQIADEVLEKVFGPARAPVQVNARMPLARDAHAARGIDRYFLKMPDDSLIVFHENVKPSFESGRATADGTYRVTIEARCHQSQSPIVMAVYGGDVIAGRGPRHLVSYFVVDPGEEWTKVTFEDYLERGGCYQMVPYQVRTPYVGPRRFQGPGLRIREVSVEGPLEAWPPKSRKELLGSIDVNTAGLKEARDVFTGLLPKAFRRPTAPEEVEPFLALTKSAMDDGRPFVEALSVGLKAVLCSPKFLLREDVRSEGTPDAVTSYTLASRLSYFLWSSMPDSELMELAGSGELAKPQILHDQVERMLSDPKAYRFIVNFTGQWLGLRDINFTEPDARLFPEFDEMLRYSMEEETVQFFSEILEHDESVLDFVDSDWLMLNERMAAHYDFRGIQGLDFRRVNLPKGHVRGGVLTQASVLKITSNGTNTSPVVRGNWVLTNILGKPSPPPPPNVPGIEPDIRSATSIRERLARHRDVESCAVCHNRIDPPGFAMESFDPIGGQRNFYRTLEVGQTVNRSINGQKVKFKQGARVDPSGQLSQNQKFADITGLKKFLLQDPDQIVKCLTEKLLIYSLGRPLGFSDRSGVESIVKEAAEKKYGLRSLIHEVVLSHPFHEK